MKNLEQTIAKSTEAKLALSKVGIELGDNILVKVWGESMEILTCEDDTLTTKVFGGSIDVNGFRDWKTKNREIKINVGSMGAFDPTCKASVSKVMMQHTILTNWDKFVLVSSLLMDRVEAQDQLEALLED